MKFHLKAQVRLLANGLGFFFQSGYLLTFFASRPDLSLYRQRLTLQYKGLVLLPADWEVIIARLS